METIKEMSFSEMETIQGGGFCEGLQAGLIAGAFVASGMGWNPIGWGAALIVGGVSIYASFYC